MGLYFVTIVATSSADQMMKLILLIDHANVASDFHAGYVQGPAKAASFG